MKNSHTARPQPGPIGLSNLAIVLSLSAVTAVAGCSPAAEVSPPPAEPTTPAVTSVAVATVSGAEAAPTEPPPPSAEELERQASQEQLARDFMQLEQDNAAELQRLTPEVRAQVTALVEKSPPVLRSALSAALKGPQRRPGHAERDGHRHPSETLEFLGLQPNHAVLEYGPGEGWYTELLAPVLFKRGKLFVTLTDPNGSKEVRPTYYGKRTQLALASLPEAYSKVERVIFDPSAPALNIPDATLDVVLLFRGTHGMVNAGTLDAWLAEFHRTLKPKGILGIEQHRAAGGADAITSSKQGYLPEAFVIERLEQAGFKLAKKSEVNANPKDTKDYADGVWALPPSLRGGEQDKAKYLDIGESDRMTLKFIKVAATSAAKVPSKPAPMPPAAGSVEAKAPTP